MATCVKAKFFVCERCGNMIDVIMDSKVPMVCCGEKMTEISANTTDAAQEKHVPVVTINGNKVHVEVGSVIHPMTEEHHIAWIYLETEKGVQRACLPVTGEPKADFLVAEGDKAIAVYEFCNLHGVWVAKL